MPKGPTLTLLSRHWAAAVTLTLSALCAFGPACAVGELPDLTFALCWVPPPSAVDQTPFFLVVASTMLLIPNVSGSDDGHRVLGRGEGWGGERGGAGQGRAVRGSGGVEEWRVCCPQALRKSKYKHNTNPSHLSLYWMPMSMQACVIHCRNCVTANLYIATTCGIRPPTPIMTL